MSREKRVSPLRAIGAIVLRLIVILAIVFALLMYVIPAFERADRTAVPGSADWMARLDDGLPLGGIVLPGTHDSATKNVLLAWFSKCQSLDIGAQLDAGYRYLDIRLAVDGERLRLMHGFAGCTEGPFPWSGRLYLDAVLEQCRDFLRAHPTEAVVFAVKQEHGDESVAEFERLLDRYCTDAEMKDFFLLTDRIPTLGEARGRLVLMRRYEDAAGLGAAGGIPLLWDDQGGREDTSLHTAAHDNGSYHLYVQDRYKYGDTDKWKAFLGGMAAGETGADAVSINFLSTNGTAAYGHPYAHAKALNDALLSWDNSVLRGWIVVDFASPKLAERIWSRNLTAPEPEPEAAGEPEPEPAPYRAAYEAYLDTLLGRREALLSYDWQRGTVYDAERDVFAPAGETANVALADVWGDETPELLYLDCTPVNGYRIAAALHVCTYDGALRELYAKDGMDTGAGGGMHYRLFRTDADKGLWLYTAEYGEAAYETYTHFAPDGAALAPAEEYTRRSYYNYSDEADVPEGAFVEEFAADGKEVSAAEYAAAIPAEAEQDAGLLIRNARYYENDPDLERPEDAYDYGGGSALTYDGAVARLRGELGIEPESMDDAALFAAMPEVFSFCSGAGGWETAIFPAADGSFTGLYQDTNYGESGDGYDGAVYVCRFHGRFGDVKRVDDYTYTMRCLELEIEPFEQYIETMEDGWRLCYIPAPPYGMQDADEIAVYLPGAQVGALPWEFVDWVAMPNAWDRSDLPVLLPGWGLYNVNAEAGFFSFEGQG